MKKLILASTALSVMMLSGCQTAGQHLNQVRSDEGERVTVGTVQREIKVGMSSADVIAALGSPNILSTDEKSREVWVYDKLSTETAVSTSSGGLSLGLLNVWGTALGGAGGNYNESSGAKSRSQRTLTIIIKFDENKKVRETSYHTSRF